MMNRRKMETLALLGEVIVAALLSASMTLLFSDMLLIDVRPLLVYGTAAALAVLVMMLTYSRTSAWITLLALVTAALAAIFAGWQPVERLTGMLEAARTHEGLSTYTQDLAVITLVLLYATVYIFAHQRGSAYLMLVFLLGLMGAGWFFMGTSTSIHILPALIAVSAMFARDSERGAQFKALISLSLVAALLAVAIVPGEGVKSAWLEKASQKTLRTMMRLFNIERDNLDERRSFTIGYDGWLNRRDAFGGPAFPQNGELMRVEAENEVYLRGSIRYIYNNQAWVDEDNDSKAGKIKRYMMGGIEGILYRDEYERAFDLNKKLPDWAVSREIIAVEALSDGTSWSIFSPNRTEDVETGEDIHTYFNNIGEQFINRPLTTGDRYTLTVERVTATEEELSTLLSTLSRQEDKDYPGVLLMNRDLPSGIESRLYTLTYEIVTGLETPFEKACAIRDWLKTYGRYTLNASYAPQGRDFVSWFVLDERAGYCTFFAAAMAVMARIAGLPARYVEGYLALPDDSGECVLTGFDAHAWAEIYFENFGWMTFDATPTHILDDVEEKTGGDDDIFGADDKTPPQEKPTPTPSPTPTPEPTAEPDDAPVDEPNTDPDDWNAPENPEITPTPEPPIPPFDEPGADQPPDTENPDGLGRLLAAVLSALLLLLLLFLLIMAIRMRLIATNPVNMVKKETGPENRLMIWYRAMLTLLSAQGLTYETGDTPLSFAENAVKCGLCPAEFLEFSRAVSESRYAERDADEYAFRLAERAYRAMDGKIHGKKRLRWLTKRVFHGIGAIDPVP